MLKPHAQCDGIRMWSLRVLISHKSGTLKNGISSCYSRNYRTLMKEIEEDKKRWKTFHAMDWKNKHC